ncbi:MAG: hypothetical protein K2H01_07545 [Ruminococcus sp.]|nr:hypothetical protein [Ruminococcus sp.]
MAYATYREYQNVYSGTLFTSKEQFFPLSKRASEYIDAVTFGRLESGIPEEFAEKVKKCCCALAENIFYYDAKSQPDAAVSGGAKQQETISKYSVTFRNPLDSLSALTGGSFETYQYNTALRYLGRTGLMYRGV